MWVRHFDFAAAHPELEQHEPVDVRFKKDLSLYEAVANYPEDQRLMLVDFDVAATIYFAR